MKCNNCNEEYNQEMFSVCPYCLFANDNIQEEKDSLVFVSDKTKDEIYNNELCGDSILVEISESLDVEDNSVEELSDDANDEIEISDISELGNRSKNALHRAGIFTFGQLRAYVKDNDLLHIRNLGASSMREINNVLETYSTVLKIQPVQGEHTQLKISDISELSIRSKNALNRAEIFTLGDLIDYISDKELSDIRNLGSGSINEIMRYLEKHSVSSSVGQQKDIDFKLFKHINEQLQDLSIELLITLGIPTRTVNQLANKGILKIQQLQNITERALARNVRDYNVEKFRDIEDHLKKTIYELLEMQLNKFEDDEDFQIALMKAEGFTLQDIGDIKGVSRERVRQIIKKFNQKLNPLVEPIIEHFMFPKEYMKSQELLDIYDKDSYDKILVQWCRMYEKLEYLDFADAYIRSGESKHFYEEKILSIATEFIGEGLDLYDSMEELDYLLKKNGFSYLDAGDIMNLVQKNGFKVYGNYVAPGRQSYGYLCARIVAKRFQNGIKLYDSTDLNILRKYVLEEYGDIGVAEDNRTLSTRLADFLILSGRGAATASENVQVELSLLEEIKTYIDDSPEGELYYSNLFSEFEGMLQIMSNIDNYNFLHGVLMLYYPDDYYYTRDYLKKKGSGYISGRLCDKISRFIKEKHKPMYKNDIKRKFSGMSDIVLTNAVNASDDLFLWDYNLYHSIDLLVYDEDDLDYLKNAIQTIMTMHNGYCSDSLLYSYVQNDNSEFLHRNKMDAENNLYYFCAKKLSEFFDFRRPHIGQKGLMREISVKNVALYILNNPDILSYSEYVTVADKLKWSAVTTGMVFTEIEQGYIRISDDLYVKKEMFSITNKEIELIEKCIYKHMNYDFTSLMSFEFWEELPDVEYEWNKFLLHSILANYSTDYRIIEPRTKDRRFERGIVVEKECKIQDYIDAILHMLHILGKNEISENNLTTLLIVNGLAYKMIPHEVYVSEKIAYRDERFVVNV